MKNRIALVVALVVVGLTQAGVAQKAGIKVLCATALKTVMEELAPQFEKATGNKVAVEYGGSAPLQRKVEAGEPFDAVFLTVKQLDALVQSGKIASGTRTPIARSGMAIAIRAAGGRPDISTTEALKRAVIGRSIAYSPEGASGVYFMTLAKRLGIADRLKLRSADGGEAVGAAVAEGTAELGILPVSEILPVKGIEMLGEFPKDVQDYVVVVAGVGTGAKQAAAAGDLIKFASAPAAAPILKKKGMEPER